MSEEAIEASTEMMASSTAFIGVYVMLAAAAPLLLLIGAALVQEKKAEPVTADEQEMTREENEAEAQAQRPVPVKRQEGFITIKKILVSMILAAVIGITGLGLMIYGMKDINTYELYEMLGMEDVAKASDSFSYFDVSDHYTVTGNVNNTYDVSVSDDGEFFLTVAVEGGNEDCLCGVKLLDKNGAVVYDAGTGADWTLLSNPIALTKGDYTVVFEYRCTDGVEVNEEFACRVTLTR